MICSSCKRQVPKMIIKVLGIIFLTGFLATACLPPEGKDCMCKFSKAIYEPICGSDGKTYDNKYDLKCQQRCQPDLKKVHNGKCKKETGTISDCVFCKSCEFTKRLYPDVCGTDGKTYDACRLACHNCRNDKKVGVEHDGECKEEECDLSVCPYRKIGYIGGPPYVCGTDGRTYDTKDHLYCAQKTCNRPNLKVAYKGKCKKDEEECDLTSCPMTIPVYNPPVCGSDGKTYKTKDHLYCAITRCHKYNLEVAFEGPCKGTDGENHCSVHCNHYNHVFSCR